MDDPSLGVVSLNGRPNSCCWFSQWTTQPLLMEDPTLAAVLSQWTKRYRPIFYRLHILILRQCLFNDLHLLSRAILPQWTIHIRPQILAAVEVYPVSHFHFWLLTVEIKREDVTMRLEFGRLSYVSR
ncbi:hypothetical protein U1Q18_006939 [Sarracenia purpurea var. burkii]